MCDKCVSAVEEIFPDCPEDMIGDFLFATTPFPFGSHEVVRKQLLEAKGSGCKTYMDAIARANQEMIDQMAKDVINKRFT